MKNLVLGLTAIFMLTTFIGCNKKKQEEAVDLNAVITESVVSVDESMNADFANAVPVVVENTSEATEIFEPAMAPASTDAALSNKPSARQIQQALKNAGIYNGKIDGSIGPKTKKAIEAFQSQNGLKADGKVGKKTWAALSVYLNKTPEVVNPSADTQVIAE